MATIHKPLQEKEEKTRQSGHHPGFSGNGKPFTKDLSSLAVCAKIAHTASFFKQPEIYTSRKNRKRKAK